MQRSGASGDGGDRPPAMSARQLLRQQRELAEKRKYGLVPLAVDSVTQAEISPNVPQTLAQAPWFYGVAGPTLAHQRQRDAERNDVIEDKGDVVTVHAAAARYVAGACKNCGARTHKTHECTQAKKKVGAVYTGRVTGHDVVVTRVERSYAQKRDRYAGDVGVDLLRGYNEDDGKDGEDDEHKATATTSSSDADAGARHRRRVEDVFASRTAQHGGVAIKELPKYLHSLDAPADALLFDPRTGAMRANPNAQDATRTFRGDLERYRSGDYYNYVETQCRFLSGQSKSFVDFAYDEELRRAREGAQGQRATAPDDDDGGGGGGDDGTAADTTRRTVDDIVVRALHADATTTTTTRSSGNDDDDAVLPPLPSSTTTTSVAVDHVTPPPSSSMSAEEEQLLQLSLLPVATHNGHRLPYGSYLDTTAFTWGYKCCRRLGKHAPSCAM